SNRISPARLGSDLTFWGPHGQEHRERADQAIVDVETTGTDPRVDEIIELGMRKFECTRLTRFRGAGEVQRPPAAVASTSGRGHRRKTGSPTRWRRVRQLTTI